jgi:hypothetical protein
MASSKNKRLLPQNSRLSGFRNVCDEWATRCANFRRPVSELKIRWSQGRVGSTPSSGTTIFIAATHLPVRPRFCYRQLLLWSSCGWTNTAVWNKIFPCRTTNASVPSIEPGLPGFEIQCS